MLLCVDTETTGLNNFHGCKPFFVSTCNEQGEQVYWEWEVNPFDRQPMIPEGDIQEIVDLLFPNEWQYLVLQNGKFDVHALATLHPKFGTLWPWNRMQDTIIAGHLLRSDRPHDLTTLVLDYLEYDISRHEGALKAAAKEARREARKIDFVRTHGEWRLADKGLPELPSATQELWKNDLWLPRAVARTLGYPENHPWHTVLRDYANMDTASTLVLWLKQKELLQENDLWEIYRERMKAVPVAYAMEHHGVTVTVKGLSKLMQEYTDYSARCQERCEAIASTFDYELELPKAGVNNNLRTFLFDHLKLPGIKGHKAKTNNASLTKQVMQHYLETTRPASKSHQFIKSLLEKRTRDTAVQYMKGYLRFALPYRGGANAEDGRQPEPDGTEATEEVSRQNDEEPELLDLDGGPVQERVRSASRPGAGGTEGTSGELHTPPRGDTGRVAGSAQVRQPEVCKPGTPLPRHSSRQHTGHDRKGKGRQGKGNEASGSETDGRGREEYAQALRLWQKDARTTLQDVRYKQKPHVLYTEAGLLEASGVEWLVLHPSLNMTGTATLRWSSSNPNSQNVSKREGFNLRYCFGPAPGRIWVSCDAQNIELRLPAYEAGEEAMIALFERPDDPPYFGSNHLLAAHIIHPEKFNACLDRDGVLDGRIFKERYPDIYRCTKNGSFAVQYGAQVESGTADRAYGVKGAQAKIQSRLGKIANLNRRMIAHAEEHGYVETIPDRTVNPRRGYPVWCGTGGWGGKVKPTIPLSYHIQSTAMQWMAKAMVRCHAQLEAWRKKDGYDGRIVMQVHDELVFDLPRPKVHPLEGKNSDDMAVRAASDLWRVRKLQALMEEGGRDIGIPTPTSCEVHDVSWSEGIKL